MPVRRALPACLIAIIACFPGEACADWSPVLRHTKWVYEGGGTVEPFMTRDRIPRWGAPVVHYRERLTLKVIDGRSEAGALVFRVEERDSLFGRALRPGGYANPARPPLDSFPDTVAVRILEYRLAGGRFRLAGGDSLHFGHRDTADLFFHSQSSVPFFQGPLDSLGPPYRGQVSRPRYTDKLPYGDGQAWYLDDVGLYWTRLRLGCDLCGCSAKRELLLKSLDGRPIDPGRQPPPDPLAKEAQIACRTVPKGAGRFARQAAWGLEIMDLLGRLAPVGAP